MFKRCISSLVLTIFLANAVGFSLLTLLQIKLHTISEQCKNEEEKIVELKISLAEINSSSAAFHWMEEDEFTFHGHMYDVIDSHIENGLLIVKCYEDTKEGSLYEKLKEQHSSDENETPLKGKHTVLKKGIEYDHKDFSFSCIASEAPADQQTAAELFVASVFRTVASPPPWSGL